jgi:hypothetical protein
MKQPSPTDRAALMKRLLAGDEGPDSTLSSFLRGLTAGALIGAAIAGSALLQRRRMSKPEADDDSARTRGDSIPSNS